VRDPRAREGGVGALRIGVVSDTHNHLGNVARIVELLNAARVERVVHTGDITQPKTLELLARLDAPLVGVFGNNDEREPLREAAARLGFELGEPPLERVWAARRIVVVHDPRDLGRALRAEHALALHGHTHRHVVERSGGCLVFNPGECAGHLPGRNAVGVVDLASLAVELLRF
jgi:putative phosphoesterase